MEENPPNKTKNQSEAKNVNAKTFVSGGLAGCIAKTLVAPIDRVKILLQVHSVHYEGAGVLNVFRRIVNQEGWLSLYKGNGAQMLRIFPYAAMQFTSYEMYKKMNKNLLGADADHFLNTLICGSAAGITAVSTTYPLDVIRSRLAFQYKGEHLYSGIADCIKKIYHEERSIRSFYRGYLITIMGMVPYAGLSFSTFEHIKKLLLRLHTPHLTMEVAHSEADHITRYYELTVAGKLICGACTGIIAQTITYPVDVVRRHMQLSSMFADAAVRKERGIWQTLNFVYTKYGIVNGLYRGITLNYIRAIPMVSTSFCFYELSKKFLGLKTGELVKLS